MLQLREGHWTMVAVHSGRDVVRPVPFEAVDLALGELWPEGETA